MNILGNNSSKLNELIFENRNKNYGAYVIRETYSNSLMKSLLGLSSLIIIVFGSAYAYNKVHEFKPKENTMTFNDPNIEPLEYVTDVDNTPLPKPIQNTAAAVAPAGAIGTVINDNAIETNSVNVETSLNGTGSATATGVAPTGPEISTLTISAPVTNVVPAAPSEAVVFAEEMPEFEGGDAGLMKYVANNITYPEIAKEIGKEGTVYVSFVVNELGYVENAKVIRGIGYGCDEEVVKVVSKMPRWKKAGKNGGHPVKVRFNIPVAFRLK